MPLLLVSVRKQHAANQLGTKAAVLEETRSARPVPEVGGAGRAEALAGDLGDPLLPDRVPLVQPVGDDRILDPALAQLSANARRPVAAGRALGDVLLGVTRLALQAALRQVVQQGVNDRRLAAARRQLAPQLDARVLAGREQANRRLLELCRGPAQASASTSASAVAGCGKALARICASISAQISGLLLRNCRAFSLPCPIRSPL
jgi:hypothetical protein